MGFTKILRTPAAFPSEPVSSRITLNASPRLAPVHRKPKEPCGNGLGGVVESWNLRSNRAQDFVGNRVRPLGDIGSRNFVMSLAPDDHRFIAHGSTRDLGHIHHHHIHTDQSRDGSSTSPDENRASIREVPAQPIGIADRENRNACRTSCGEGAIVADCIAWLDGSELGNAGLE